jgi:uncharacterized membrane protein YdjX (TVP38/TMEM64 family)
VRWTVFGALLAAVVVGAWWLAPRSLSELADAVNGLGRAGPWLFGVCYIGASLLLLPAAPFGFAAGALFRPVFGATTMWLAGPTAAALGFLNGRHYARDKARAHAAHRPKFRCLDEVIAENDWKVVALLRISHGFPFGLVNYFCGVTAARFWPYLLASAVAMLPGTILSAYFGAAGRAGVAAFLERDGTTPAEWISLGVGVTATALLLGYVYRLVHSKLCAETVTPTSRTAAPDSTPT